MKIAIKFPHADSDFCNTFFGVSEVLLAGSKHQEGLPKDKKYITKIINEISYGCYIFFQKDINEKFDKSIRKYLKITTKNILIDKEIKKNIKWINDNPEIVIILKTKKL